MDPPQPPFPKWVTSEQTTFTVERGPILSQRIVQGEVVPSHQDKLYFRSSGLVDSVYFKNGETFKKGDILAELEISDLQDELQQAQIDLSIAQDDLALDQLQKAYNLQLAESDAVIAQKEVDLATIALNNSAGSQKETAQINLDIANEKLKTAQAWLALVQGKTSSDLEQIVEKAQFSVDRLNQQILDRQLIAPYDGIVLYMAILPGQTATAYDDSVAFVGDPKELVIQTPYISDLATNLTPTSEVNLFLTDDKNPLYPVQYIPSFLPVSLNQEGTVVQGGSISLTYLFFTMPENYPSDQIKVGNQVDLQVTLGNKEDALLISPAAIRGNDAFKYVIVLEDDYHRRVEIVTIGIQTTDKWEVISENLKEGDLVLGP